jgi:hypothetical protein
MEAEAVTAERWAPPWWIVFLTGLVLWAASFGVARLTHNVILLPTIVLLGSFLVPVTAVVWYLDHDPSPALSPRRIVAAFIIAGCLGVLGASLLEYWLVSVGVLGALEVGLIEEAGSDHFISVMGWCSGQPSALASPPWRAAATPSRRSSWCRAASCIYP